ncbi:hypothetical protein D1AOALGA4SA_7833 [Olavius algarvensis Delta 1 endosymbiont]|nr:hypothetical protein D1AOALGA4SA_7833 [Olavius algarvensis Delta 1 endosymbiont]
MGSQLEERSPNLWGRSSKSEAPSLKRYQKSSICNFHFPGIAGSPQRGDRLVRVGCLISHGGQACLKYNIRYSDYLDKQDRKR